MNEIVTSDPAKSPLEELYNRDPNKWTKEDVETIVRNLRAQRKNFADAEIAAANKPKATKTKAVKPPKPVLTGPLSLGDLGLLTQGGNAE